MKKNEKLFVPKELENFRTSAEYIKWFDTLLEKTRYNKENERAALLHQDEYKIFYEELFPTAYLLKAKKNEWSSWEFKSVKGSQPYDVEIKNGYLNYLEITCTTFNYDEHFRMEVFLDKGSVSTTDKILKNKKGKPIGIDENEQISHNELFESIIDRIIEKSIKQYPKNTGLVVFHDDMFFSDNDYRLIEHACNCAKKLWDKTFTRLYVIGLYPEKLIEI